MLNTISTCLLICIITSDAKRAVYVRQAEVQDQNSASSGYAYNSHSGPVSYVHFSNGFGGENFQYPFTGGSYQYYEPYNKLPQYIGYNLPKLYGYGDLKDFKHKGFEVTQGDNYGGSHYEENGQDGHKGYNTDEKYEKGSQGKHDNENIKGYYNKEGGDKNSHQESTEHFSKGNEAAKGFNGGSYSESSGHKKGSKTTGYHKVYKKNEYKKDNTFYDESDKRGHFNKYANADSYHKGESGALEKGGHSDVKFHETNQGENGDYDKGHYDVYDSKFRDHQGNEGYRENYSGHAKDSKENNGDVYGFKEH